jgi:predicted ATPase
VPDRTVNKQSGVKGFDPAQYFTGRSAELNELKTSLQGLSAGRGRLVLLSGAGGIGKTALAQHFIAQIDNPRKSIYWSNCWERSGSPPYWHWIQLVRQVSATVDRPRFRELLGRSAAYIARLAPELETDLRNDAGAEPSAYSELRPDEWPARERFKSFEAICHFLQAAGSIKPLVAVFDDLHLADTDTLELLLFVAKEIQQMPVALIGIFRSDYPYSDAHKNLFDGLQRITRTHSLDGFSLFEVDEFVQKRGILLPNSTVAHLTKLTDGNPFFLEETLRLLERAKAPDAALFLESQPLVSDRIRNIVRERLKPLSANTIEALGVAAVIGREFELDLLSSVIGSGLTDLYETLNEAVDHQLLEESTTGSGGYRFIQAMVAETIASDLPRGEFFKLHCKVGEALEFSFRDNLEPILPRLALHFLRAGAFAPQEKALKYAVQSARRAMHQLAYEEAERLAVLAISVCRSRLVPDPEVLCELQVILGEARSRGGKLDGTNDYFFQAAATARDANRPDLLARAALKVSPATGVGTVDRRLISLIEEALRAPNTNDSALKARLLAKLAACFYWSERRGHAEELSREAVAAARKTDDIETLIFALFRNHYALWSPDNLTERLNISPR